MKYLAVDLYKDFQCIADACPNTCCAGWRVQIDKETYARMIEKEEQLGILAREWIDDGGEIISVKLDRDGRCPMLTENNLCKVVLKLGPEYLCKVCTTYPRMHFCYGDTMEGHLNMSCPQVILKLMERRAIGFDVGQDRRQAAEYPHGRLYLFERAVRSAIIGVLQGSLSISLNTRLFTAFTVLEEGIRMYQNDQLDGGAIEDEVRLYAQESVLRGVEARLTQAVDKDSQCRFLGRLLKIAEGYKKHERFSELTRQAAEYFRKGEWGQYPRDVQAFKEACLGAYANFYTNYWVYRIFSDTLSIPDYEKSKEKFIYIAVEFALFQTIALASFVKRGSLDQEEYVYIISCLSRMMEHTKSLQEELMEQIHEQNLASGAGILLMTVL